MAAYSADDFPTMDEVGRRFGISRETVRLVVRRWEQASGQAIMRSHQRRRRAKEAARKRMKPPTIAQRLVRQVRPIAATDCLEWQGRMHEAEGGSYPAFCALGEQFAHRVAYRLWRGPIPPGHVLLRECPRPACINPFHREACSAAKAAAARFLGRKRPPATHCKRGHPLTPENVKLNPGWEVRDGQRVRVDYRLCRICTQDRQKRNYKPAPRRPPLPSDEFERWIERAIRAVEKAPTVRRSEVLARQLDYFVEPDEPIVHPAQEAESFTDYRDRTSGGRGEWVASRISGSPRVQKALRAKPRLPRVTSGPAPLNE